MRFQTRLTLALCSRLGLRRVLFVGHSDGALLALLTSAVAADMRSKQPGGLPSGASVRLSAGYAPWQSLVPHTAPQLLYRSQSEPPSRMGMGASLTNRRLPTLFGGKGVPAPLRQQHGSPPRSEADAIPSEPSTPDSRSRGECPISSSWRLNRIVPQLACGLQVASAAQDSEHIRQSGFHGCSSTNLASMLHADSSSSQLTVVIVAPMALHQRSPSTVTEEDPQSNAELGLLSPMLSPRAASSSSGVPCSCFLYFLCLLCSVTRLLRRATL